LIRLRISGGYCCSVADDHPIDTTFAPNMSLMESNRARNTQWWFIEKDGVNFVHRANGPARIDNKVEQWYFMGEHHRIGGPAEIFSFGGRSWWENDQRHRLDGCPAVISPYHHTDMLNLPQWYVRGKLIDHFAIFKRHDLDPDWTKWTEAERLLMMLAIS
jgi:hypothetical protein